MDAVTDRRSPACPFCGALNVEKIGQWGGQMITAQWRCCDCSSYFEAIREEFDDTSVAQSGDSGD